MCVENQNQIENQVRYNFKDCIIFKFYFEIKTCKFVCTYYNNLVLKVSSLSLWKKIQMAPEVSFTIHDRCEFSLRLTNRGWLIWQRWFLWKFDFHPFIYMSDDMYYTPKYVRTFLLD